MRSGAYGAAAAAVSDRDLARNCRNPNFGGLDPFLRHMGDMRGSIWAPRFQNFIAGVQKDEGIYLKQVRLVREEADQAQKQQQQRSDAADASFGQGPKGCKKK